MNQSKLDRLFALARDQKAPAPAPDFAAGVLRAVGREPVPSRMEFVSVFEELNDWFPRAAAAAVALMILCVGADYGFTTAGLPELGDSSVPASAQLFFNLEDF
ncbi:MAG: hypothetical protein WCH99_06000 [Verrucomicrobiota bacterium]